MNSLFVAWRSGAADRGAWGPVGRLDFVGTLYRFCYTRGAKTLAGFVPFPGLDDLEQVYETVDLLPLFANRLLSPSRPEYEEFLRWGGFNPNNPPDPIALLGVTEGIRQTDGIEVFPCPTPDFEGCYVNKFFLHGIRWMPPWSLGRINDLEAGERLVVQLEPCNEADSSAVAIRTETLRTIIGYVPRYLARDVWKLLVGCNPDLIDLTVERLNRDAPVQNRVLCKMRTCWPDEFRPCSDDDYLPIPIGIPACHS